MSRLLFNKKTNTILPYVRDDDEPVIGLDREVTLILEAIYEPEPKYDPNTHRVQPLPPEISITDPDGDDINGTVTYGWELLALEVPPPPPDWISFKLLSQNSPEFKEIIKQALVLDPVNALGLQTELNEVIRGADSRPFYTALSSVFLSVGPEPSVIRSFAAAARLMHLPVEFVDMLIGLVNLNHT